MSSILKFPGTSNPSTEPSGLVTTSPPEIERLEFQLTWERSIFGWEPGWPEHITAKAREIDEAVCRRSSCPECGRKNRKCMPFKPLQGRGYSVTAFCVHCGHHESM